MKPIIPDIILERYILDECSSEEKRIVECALSEDVSVRERCENLKMSNSEILSSYPAPFVASRIKESVKARPAREKRMNRRTVFGISLSTAAMCVAAAAVFVMLPTEMPVENGGMSLAPKGTPSVSGGETVRFKGSDVRLNLYRKTANEPEELSPDSVAMQGDEIQIGFQSLHQYAVIFSIDGRGNVTLHYPDNEYASTQIEKGKKTLLSKSYRLDDAPQYEKFYIVTSDVGVNTGFIMKSAREFAVRGDRVLTESLTLSGTKIETFTIRKE